MKRRKSGKNKKGQALLEYLVVTAVICLGMMVIGVGMKSSFDDYFDKIVQKLINVN